MKTSAIRTAAACALLASTCLVSPALAQTASPGLPSIHKTIDDLGVDLVDGSFNFSTTIGSIGAGESLMALEHNTGRGGTRSNYPEYLQLHVIGNVMHAELVLGNMTRSFTGPVNGTFSSSQGDGATLIFGQNGDYLYTDSAGVVTRFGVPPGIVGANELGTAAFCTGAVTTACRMLPLSTQFPNGRTLTFAWDVQAKYDHYDDMGEIVPRYFYRLRSIDSGAGTSIRFTFVQEALPPGYPPPPTEWYVRAGATFHNASVGSQALASVTYTYPGGATAQVTDTGGHTWTFSSASNQTGIRRPGSAADNIVVTRDTAGRVSQITADGVSSSYSYADAGSTRTTVATNALGEQRTVISNLAIGRPTSVSVAGRTTSFQYDALNRLHRLTAPEGDVTEYGYDGRGNVTLLTRRSKGDALPALIRQASFPPTCANPATCNQPTSITDERGHVTEYGYHPHGGVHTVTPPVPSAGQARPQVVYSYGAVGGVQMLTGVSQCATAGPGGCGGTADEVRTTIAYGANLLPTTISSGAGNGSLTATQMIAYDGIGNIVSVDGPLPGAADTVHYRYDLSRRLVGTISPDPDGGGPLPHRAERRTYDPAGFLTGMERGTVAGTSPAQWAAFAPLEAVEIVYAEARPVARRLVAGGTTHALSQTSYDALGRVRCTAQRMNPSAFAAPPADACVVGAEGAFGPDRISRISYNEAGEVIRQESAVGAAGGALVDVELSWTPNGQVATATDGEGNRTTYEYDAHDRVQRIRYPVTTVGANASSTTDYEELGYDQAGNVTSRRVRSGEHIGFTYDTLNRLTFKNLPGAEPDVSYAYDNLGRLVSASQPGMALGFTYDALGRNLTQSGPLGTVTSQYDLAGRRMRLVHPDGFTVNHTYLVTGEMASITQPGGDPFSPGVTLATFGYDNLGRRTQLTRGNGTVTTYGYDPVSRLTQLGHDLAGTARDLNLIFAYNPSGQIASNTRSNDAYAWTGHGSGTTSYGHDGLNRMTSAGGLAIGHDARGNVTGDPAMGLGYGYSSENLLTTVNGGAWTGTLTYDPLMRLFDSGVGARTRVLHDGHSRIAEYNIGGTQVARYVFGPGVDEPLIEYRGGGLATRRWLHADERGTIVAASDDAGNGVEIGRFDEYGRRQSFAGGRFGYAGMPYETVSELFYARARMYNPRLGRFMQTDPIGYGDGMNMYAYVRNDPVNFVDPTGEAACGSGFVVCAPRIQDDIGWILENLQGNDGSGPFEFGGGAGSESPTPPCKAPPTSMVGAARTTIGGAQAAVDVATVASAATGIGVPVSGSLTILNNILELGLVGVNAYDAIINGDNRQLSAQLAALPVRLLPAGRTIQNGLRAARGPTGPLRNSQGQFRTSRINNPGVREAGDVGAQRTASAGTTAISCAVGSQ